MSRHFTRQRFFALLACAFSLLLAADAQQPAPSSKPGTTFEVSVPPFSNNFPLTSDSIGKADGISFHFDMKDSKVFPSTYRTITVYVPEKYDGKTPACVFVFLDGIGFHAPVVFDNLISRHQMPVTIAIGITPGQTPGGKPERYDRSFEFDNRTSRLATFILDEVLPAVEAQKLPNGRSILLSHDANDRAIAGVSTGGIAAFNVAWQRPDAFRRVFTAIGTFVGMRGGEQMYVQVRKTEPKPIRVFMQDGAYDGWGGGLEMGDWWMANQTMERALSYAGYDVRHSWGSGNHNGGHSAQVFPEAVRWLWRDWPKPITAGAPGSQALKPILLPDEPWKTALDGCKPILHLAAGKDGHVVLARAATALACPTDDSSAFAFGTDGHLYTAEQGSGLHVSALAVRNNGDVYLATPSEIWLQHPGGEKTKVADGLKNLSAIALTPDGHWMFAVQSESHLSYNYHVREDGTLDSGEPFYDLYVPADADGSGANSVAFDREGRAYVATKLGVQILDHNGRVLAILPLPNNAAADSLCFGGDDFTTLYVSSQGKLYTRKLAIGGVFPAAAPTTIPDWEAG